MRDGLGKSASMDRGFRKWTKGWNLRMSGLQLIGEVCSLVEQGSGAELVSVMAGQRPKKGWS
jgi:hypothetical protein